MTPKDMSQEITEIIEQYGDDVYRVAFAILKSKELAEDIFQETFLRVCRSFSSYRGDSSLKTWITSIAVNLCRDYMRSSWKRRVVITDEFVTYTSSDSDTEEIIEKRSERDELLKAVMNLSDKYREVVILYYYQELDIKEISRVLKIPQGTVKSRLYKARNLLYSMMGGEAHG
ncbi:MAG: sigma-70 family RNA polymerase sigma factor [Clostridiaceae bacterium]|nr:sigma-70 family RNA polymerase sigma factor [Clostridiaceae bacterium]